MPTLRITYRDLEIFSGEVDGFTWDDTEGNVAVTGRIKRATTGGGLGAIADMITAASRKKTEAMIADKTAADVIEGTD